MCIELPLARAHGEFFKWELKTSQREIYVAHPHQALGLVPGEESFYSVCARRKGQGQVLHGGVRKLRALSLYERHACVYECAIFGFFMKMLGVQIFVSKVSRQDEFQMLTHPGCPSSNTLY